ncbi:MAG: hypothetical protein OEQ15_02275 [Nitrosopumilus sp.]|nr:hypothetical protein [Nitrosopumilus sp.]
MVVPIIVLLGIPILLGIVYVTPFDQPEEIEKETITEEPDLSILYFILMSIWTIYLLKILIQIKRGTFKLTQRH